MYRAFQGASGWYVAWERSDGSHKAPAAFQSQSFMPRAKAESEAERQNAWEREERLDRERWEAEG